MSSDREEYEEQGDIALLDNGFEVNNVTLEGSYAE